MSKTEGSAYGRSLLSLPDKCLFYRDGAGAVGEGGEMDADGIGGEKVVDELGPLDEAEGTGVEVVFVAHVVDLVELLDAVEVEMVNPI